VAALTLAPSLAPQLPASKAAWLLDQEARALLTRLDRVKPFVLQETMVPAAALMPAAQAAIDRYLMRGRRELRERVVAYIHWLSSAGRGVPAPEIQRRFTVLKLQFNAALSQLDLFAEAINQRSTHDFGIWLGGLDLAAQDALSLAGGYYETPPVVCGVHGSIGGAIRRTRTRLPGGGASPVAMIRIPRERMIGYGVASSLVHECGHQGAALLRLVESLQPAVRQAGNNVAPRLRAAWRHLERWISEIVADTWAIAKIGISSTLGLIGIVSLPRTFVFRVDPEDPHPFPWIRVRLSCAIGDALYPHAQWRQLAETWNSLYPPDGLGRAVTALLPSLLDSLPGFIRLLLGHRPASLRGRSFGEVLHMAGRDPERLLALHAAWNERPGLIYAAPPTLAFAVVGRARMTGRITPEEEGRTLGALITHWALHGTLDLLESCSARRSSRPSGGFEGSARVRAPFAHMSSAGIAERS
jgi:hypothetical protein